MRLKPLYLVLYGLIVFTWVGCDSQDPGSQEVKADFEAAYERARQVSGLKSLLVVQDGDLVGEEYFSVEDENDLYHVRSVTKSVISTLVGIAIEEGFISNVNQPIGTYLGVVVEDTLEAEKRQITIQQLLTMTGGFEWQETGGPEYNSWIRSPDQINYVLDKPLVATPGQVFNYNSGTVHLLSVVLTEATGMSTQDFADRFLFRPIGILERDWETNARGYFNGGAGLELRPRDMAQLGRLFLEQGRSGSKTVVPEAWVDRAVQAQAPVRFSYGPLNQVGYGYLWWIHEHPDYEAFFAWGYGGQFIYCVPSQDLVVVTTAQWRVSSSTSDAQAKAILDLIVNHVVPVGV